MTINGQWYQTGTDNISITIVPKYNVTFKNDFALQPNGANGQIKVGDWGSRPTRTSPYIEAVPQNGTRAMEAFNQDYQAPGEQNYFRVYQNWSKNQLPFNSANPVQSDPVLGTTDYRANFSKQFNVSVTAASYVEPGSGGTYKVNGTNIGSTWQGTFLQYSTTPITLEAVPPSGEWVFAGWSDNSPDKYTNPRQLIPTDHTTLYATFKLHLKSTSGAVTAPSSQRKLVRDANGAYHMVYESAGQIFLTSSGNGGSTWSPERQISDGDPVIINWTPSLTYQYQDHTLYIVWEGVLGTEHAILYSTLNLSSGYLQGPNNIESMFNEAEFYANPVIATGTVSGQSYVFVVYYDNTRNAMMGHSWGSGGDGSSTSVVLREGVSQFSLAPLSGGQLVWHLAWVENYSIYYSAVPVAWPPVLGAVEIVGAAAGMVTHQSPSIATLIGSPASTGVAYVTNYGWFPWSPSSVTYRQRHHSGWNIYPTMRWSPQFGGWRLENPSLTGHHNSLDVAIAWQDADQVVSVAGQSNNAWTDPTVIATGYDPMASIGWSASTNSEVVLSRGSLSPYAITASQVIRGASPGDEPMLTVEGRGGTVRFARGRLQCVLLEANVSNAQIGFRRLPDTLRMGRSEFESALATNAFLGTGTLNVRVLFSAGGELPPAAGFRVLLQDARSDQTLAEMRRFSSVRDTVLTLTVPLHFGNRQVKVRLQPLGTESASDFQVEHWILYDVGQNASLAKATGQVSTTVNLLPSTYALHTNYPNPFNPTTEIKFDLPVAGNVSLVVYDVLGR
ncbi:MAG: hypothetical protein AAB393_04785, partial [Bacteroidota bacterium]